MAKKPSERRNFKDDEDQELNLTPMMNLIAILIPTLLVSTVFVEIAVINVSAPAIGSAPDTPPEEKKPDKPPLNLTVTITDKGYTLAASGGVVDNAAAGGGKGPTIPIERQTVDCARYDGTWPPPRSKNRDQPKCAVDPNGQEVKREFWVYNKQALQDKLIEIKDAFEDENRMTIAAEPLTEFEAITDVMDIAREVKDPAGELRSLFEEVVLSPGLS